MQPIPADIVHAILKVKKKIKKLEHDAENKHANYRYTSSEAMYEALRVEMADAGLVLLTLETGCERGQDGKSVRVMFQFILATEKSTWTHRDNVRTVYQPWMGAQSFQAAQSYAEKAYLKSLFKLSTGEPDTESVLQADQGAPRTGAKERKLTEAASKKFLDRAAKLFEELEDPAELHFWVTDNASMVRQMTDDHAALLRSAYSERMAALKGKGK